MYSVLLLGGCGYIGSAVRLHLEEQGMRVQSVDLELRGNPLNCKNLKADYRSLDRLFLQSFDTIVFLAAHASVSVVVEDPLGTIENNIVGFWQLLTKLDDRQRFLYASSGSVYDGSGGSHAIES